MRTVRISSELAPGANVINDTMAVMIHGLGCMEWVHGLKVLDASAFPLLPPRHLQTAIYMLAEKIADGSRDGR
jgi:choline dehydrogenase